MKPLLPLCSGPDIPADLFKLTNRGPGNSGCCQPGSRWTANPGLLHPASTVGSRPVLLQPVSAPAACQAPLTLRTCEAGC
jgi:hypothetical protein